MDLKSALMMASAFILQAPCGALILVKFPQLSHQFIRDSEKAHDQPDPLDDFGLSSRQFLCDAVINAKQFSAHYNPAYYKAIAGTKAPMISRTELDDPSTIKGGILNYQRWLPTYPNVNLASLRYLPLPLKYGKGGYDKVKTIMCVNTAKAKWYVTFGLIDHFMYLLEERTAYTRGDFSLRISGLLEPSPVISNVPPEHFYRQLQASSKITRMQNICNVGLNDHMRICGAVLDVLNNEGSLDRKIPQVNFVRGRERLCVSRYIESKKRAEVPAKVLRCMFRYKKADWTPFYMLADNDMAGAAFVLFEDGVGILHLHARLIQVAALLYPVGAKGKTAKSNKGSGLLQKPKQLSRKKERTVRGSKKDAKQGQKNSLEAEHSAEDTDNEDYIMSLLGRGKSKVEGVQRTKEKNLSQEDTESGDQGNDKQRTKQQIKEYSKSDKEPVKQYKTSLHKKAERQRKKQQVQREEEEEDFMEISSEQHTEKDPDEQDVEVEHYRTRLRSRATFPEKRMEQQVVIDDLEDEYQTSSEDSEEDSEDEDYNLDEDIEDNEDLTVSSWRSKSKCRQQKKKNIDKKFVVPVQEDESYEVSEEDEENKDYNSWEDFENENRDATSYNIAESQDGMRGQALTEPSLNRIREKGKEVLDEYNSEDDAIEIARIDEKMEDEAPHILSQMSRKKGVVVKGQRSKRKRGQTESSKWTGEIGGGSDRTASIAKKPEVVDLTVSDVSLMTNSQDIDDTSLRDETAESLPKKRKRSRDR